MARSVREIDKNDDKYVGIRFPLDYSPEGFFYKTKTISEQSKANLRNLLLTTPGERVFQPTFGSQLKNIIFEQGKIFQIELFLPVLLIISYLILIY